MLKRLLIYSMIGSAALATAVPSFAQDDDIVYNTIYYSDASHTTQVGFLRAGCGSVPYHLTGTQTIYSEDEPAFRCDDGVISPL